MWVILAIVILGVLFMPGIWVQRTLKRYQEPADRYQASGTGADLAKHLLAGYAITGVKVESTKLGDHYDPGARAVRLSESNYNGYSLTAITVAAHEVGHALQHARRERWFMWRTHLARIAISAERAAGVMLILAPILALVTRAPQSGLLLLILAVGSAVIGTLVHLVTLPVELDASFNKALPVLASGKHVFPSDLPHARRILRAAALTYVAGSAASLLNLARWLTVLRR